MTMDLGRGHVNYGLSYFFTFLNTYLEDGTQLSFSFSDGFGAWYDGNDYAGEDYVSINGTIYKMDLTRITNYKYQDIKSYYKTKQIETMRDGKYPDRYCKLTHKPIGTVNGGFYAIFL
jgi:hypothetical protein